ncbi:MAG: PilZ domain-containing protein [Pseudomonadota bacterium]
MSKSTLQHFISKNQTAKDKAITNEKVKQNSESARFLQRVNLPEEQRTCYKVLDMRGKAPGPYRKLEHNNKTLYLDDISFLIFQKGLKENHNIFTVGTFNQILYGKHSYMGQDALKPENEKNHGLNLLIKDQKRESIKDNSRHANIVGNYSPDILQLGYSAKRKEQRLIYVMPISLTYKDKHYDVKSRDFSINGLKVFLARTLFISGETVLLDFEQFIDEKQKLTDTSASRFFKAISYRIVDVQHINDKTYLSLIQLNLNDYTRQAFSQFINGNRVQYKLDALDILLAAKAKYVEHVYTHNLSSIPIFLSYDQKQYFIKNIIETSNNQSSVDFFLKPDSPVKKYDFTPFQLTQRIKNFAKLAYKNQSALLFVFWENNKLHSVCDFEFTQKTDLAAIALKIKILKGKIFCINTKQTKTIEQKKLKEIINYLLSMEQQQANDIISTASLFVAQLMLTDVTDVFQYESYFSLYINKEVGKASTVAVWCNNQKINLFNQKIYKEVQLNTTNIPEKIALNIVKIRYKPRYIYTIPVHLSIHHKMFKAETIDFSQNGIGVKLICDKKHIPDKNSYILVSFPTFVQKFKNINFTDILHKVARVIQHNDYLELGLIRVVEEKNNEVANFFSQLINRNKSKLDICINDRLEYTLGYVMEAYIDENINSIPLLISKDKLNGHYLKHVGLTQVACKLAEHFFLKLRGYNFKILTSDERLEELYIRTLRADKKQTQSFYLFMYKDLDEHGCEFINSFTSLEVFYQGETFNLLGKLFEKNGACIKLSFTNHLEVDASEINKINDMVLSINRHHASLFKRELADIVGFVDMVDVTQAYKKIYELQQ